jgi:hypothetical protein
MYQATNQQSNNKKIGPQMSESFEEEYHTTAIIKQDNQIREINNNCPF